MTRSSSRSDESMHTVRPRWTWVGLAVMVLGLVLVGAGVIAQSWTWAVPGLVLLVVGGGLGIYGGFFYDVTSPSVSGQMHDVVEGEEHQFPGPGTMRSESEVKRDVRRRWLDDRE
jgi:hypothetical protein